jgi:hypothetical protein
MTSGVYSKDEGSFNICKALTVIHHINKVKKENHTIIAITAEKALSTA